MQQQPETYGTHDAARVLGLSARRVQQLAEQGELVGEKAGREWRLYQHSVHAYLETHGAGRRGRSRIVAGLEGAVESDLAAREWVDRVAGLERELGRVQGRLELTEVAESTMREHLQRERERADKAEERAAQLEDDLRDARRSWWQRLFRS